MSCISGQAEGSSSSSLNTTSDHANDTSGYLETSFVSSVSGDSVLHTPTHSSAASTLVGLHSVDIDISAENILLGLGIQCLFKESGEPFDGLGVLPRRGPSAEVPSRILVEEIRQRFDIVSESTSCASEENQDVFVSNRKTPSPSLTTAQRECTATEAPTCQRSASCEFGGNGDYGRPTAASRAKHSMRSGGKDMSRATRSELRPIWRY